MIRESFARLFHTVLPLSSLVVFGCLIVNCADGEAIFRTQLDTTLSTSSDIPEGFKLYPDFDPIAFQEKHFEGLPSWPSLDIGEEVNRTVGSGVTAIGPHDARANAFHRTTDQQLDGNLSDGETGTHLQLLAHGMASAEGGVNSEAELAIWSSGRRRMLFANFTGSEDSGLPARDLDIALQLNAFPNLTVVASPNKPDVDLAGAKYFVRVTLPDKRQELARFSSTPIVVHEGQSRTLTTSHHETMTVQVAANSLQFVDLEAYIYGSALSIGPDVDSNPTEFLDRLFSDSSTAQILPTGIPRPYRGLFDGQKAWRIDELDDVSRHQRSAATELETLRISQTVIRPNEPSDLELSVDTTLGGATEFNLENSVRLPAGMHGEQMQFTLGVGTGNAFRPAGELAGNCDPDAQCDLANGLAFRDDEDQLVANEVQIQVDDTGENIIFTLLDDAAGVVQNHRFAPVVRVSDDMDGVLDGEARFTIRQIFHGIAGDANYDHRVDLSDRELWRQSYGSTEELAADFNADGRVGPADYTIWRDQLPPRFARLETGLDGGLSIQAGSAAGSAAASAAAVPEPAAIWITTGLLGFALLARRSID